MVFIPSVLGYFAPAVLRADATSGNPAAAESAVLPLLDLAFTSAWAAIRAFTQSRLPFRTASIRAVVPVLSFAFTSSPASIRAFTESALPAAAAPISAVVPSLECGFTSAPTATRALMQSALPANAAPIRAVVPLCSPDLCDAYMRYRVHVVAAVGACPQPKQLGVCARLLGRCQRRARLRQRHAGGRRGRRRCN